MGLRAEMQPIQNGREFGPSATKQDKDIARYFGRSLGLPIQGPSIRNLYTDESQKTVKEFKEYHIKVPNGHASLQSVERGVEKLIQRGDLPKGSYAEYLGENKVSLYVPTANPKETPQSFIFNKEAFDVSLANPYKSIKSNLDVKEDKLFGEIASSLKQKNSEGWNYSRMYGIAGITSSTTTKIGNLSVSKSEARSLSDNVYYSIEASGDDLKKLADVLSKNSDIDQKSIKVSEGKVTFHFVNEFQRDVLNKIPTK